LIGRGYPEDVRRDKAQESLEAANTRRSHEMSPRRFPIALALLFLLFIMIPSHGFGPPTMGWGWGGPWILPRLLFPFLMVAAVLFLLRPRFAWGGAYTGHAAGPAPSSYQGKTPEEILRERFARGELTQDQYREAVVDMLKDRYVRDELTLEEYEARVGVVMGTARAASEKRGTAEEAGQEDAR
jgi:putative membrane protein